MRPGPRILLLNVNTNTSLTAHLGRVATDAATPGTRIVATEPRWGTSSVEGYYDGYISVAAALDRLHDLSAAPDPANPDPAVGPWDAVIWAGFGDHGREGAQELLDIPVITIAEAAAHVACLLGRRYGVVTTLNRSRPQIEDNLATAGLLGRCAGIWATDLDVGTVHEDPARANRRFLEVAATARAAGADVVCLGSAALAGRSGPLGAALGLPVVDGVTAAVALAETCHRLALRTSPAYPAPRPKPRPGWPLGRPPAGSPR